MNLKRDELVLLLGGFTCAECNYDDERALEIHHIYGNGKEMPLSKTGIIEYYLENPEIAIIDLQVLCRNCHRIKSLENNQVGRKGKKTHQFHNYQKIIPSDLGLTTNTIGKTNLTWKEKWYEGLYK